MAEKLYITVSNKLLERISLGEWKTGDVLPSELELVAQYDVSRSTVRLALGRLEGLGMISRKRKRGTLLVSTKPKQVFQRQIGSLDQLEQFAQQTKLHIVEFSETTGEELSKQHEIEPEIKGRWIEYLGWRSWADDETIPVSWTRFAFDGLYEGAKDLMGKSQRPNFKVIEDAYRLKIVLIDQKIRATSVSGQVAEMLELHEGAPALEVRRLMFDERSNPVVHAHSIHKADAVSMRMRLAVGESPEQS
ncbi:GntR family transcriptional regulator [Rhodobacteraceae bacterium D3-12]|nr:GntR family transcriptional regulator [Rhodobacteraceae bacterium D3-12]